MKNIDILNHFEEVVDENGISILTLKEDEKLTFLSKLPTAFRCLYLTDEDLEWRTNTFKTSRVDEIIEKIPDLAHLISGEFSEILCYYIVPERNLPNSNLRPPKWKWKESKNIPAHFTDVVLFYQEDPNSASDKDQLISIESKAFASRPSSNHSSLKHAIDDAKKDFISRLGESLFHFKTRYKDDKNIQAVEQLERFMDAVIYPPYSKHFKAIATVEEIYAETHLNNIGVIPDNIKDSFEVILIKIKDLQVGYQQTYKDILTT